MFGVKLREIKNSICRKVGLMSISTITFVLTDKCNLRCRMCDIWQKGKFAKELTLDDISCVLNSNAARAVRYISLTGGEPFLYSELARSYQMIKKILPQSKVTISSSGTLTEQVADFLEQATERRNIFLELSMHGIIEHDFIVQVKGAFKRLERTIDLIRHQYPEVSLGVKFVITPWNYGEIPKIGDYCRERKIPLTIKMIENSFSYTNSLQYYENIENNKFSFTNKQKNKIISFLSCLNKTMISNAFAVSQIIKYLKTGRIIRSCFVPELSLFIGVDKKIYRCRAQNPVMKIVRDHKQNLAMEAIGEGMSGSRKPYQNNCRNCVALFRFLM